MLMQNTQIGELRDLDTAEIPAHKASLWQMFSLPSISLDVLKSEAIRYGATGGAGSYPFLQARVASSRYPDLATAAATTQQIEAQWAAIGSAIDEAEDRAKLAVDSATTAAEVDAAIPTEWP